MKAVNLNLLDETSRGDCIPAVDPQPGISALDVLVILASRKLLIGIGILLGAGVTASFMLLVQDYFQAQAVILPPQQQQSSLSTFASGTLGTLAGAGMASQLGLKNPADLYIGLLKSRTVSENIIRQFRLQDVYEIRLMSEARLWLLKHVSFKNGADSLITITVEDHDPKRAAAMANAFVEQLYRINSRLALTDAAQRRAFFEQQISKEKEALSQAETSLQATQKSTGLLLPSGQSEILLRSTAQMRAEISSRKVTLQALRSYATDENSQVQVLKREISTMEFQLAQLESKGLSGNSFEVSVSKLPEKSLEYFRRLRELKYHESMYELLAKQFEAARMDEAKEGSLIQVVDSAQVPDKKSGPHRASITFGSAFGGAVLSCCYIFFRHRHAADSDVSGGSKARDFPARSNSLDGDGPAN